MNSNIEKAISEAVHAAAAEVGVTGLRQMSMFPSSRWARARAERLRQRKLRQG